MKKKLLFGILLSLALIIGGVLPALSQPAYAADGGVTVNIDIGAGHADLFSADTLDDLGRAVGAGEAALSEDGTKIILEGMASSKTEADLRADIDHFVKALKGGEDWLIDNGELYESVGYKSFDEYRSLDELVEDIEHSNKKHNVPIKDDLTYYLLWGEPYTLLELHSGFPVCGKAAENAVPALPKGINFDDSEDPDDFYGPGYSWEDEDEEEVETFEGGKEYFCTVALRFDVEGAFWRCFFDEDNLDVTVVGGEVVKIDADTPGLLYVTFKATADHDWEEVTDSTEQAAASEGGKFLRCKHCGAEMTGYGVWVGETQVSSDNLSGQGWSYDVKSGTLTLNNFIYDGTGHYWETDEQNNLAAIYAENDLKVQLKGTNTIKTHTAPKEWVYSIYGEEALTIDGGGVLDFPGGGADDNIVANNGDLVVNNGTIKTCGERSGLHVFNGDLHINGGNLSVEGPGWSGICVNSGDLEIKDADVNVSVKGDAMIAWGCVIINSGAVTVAGGYDNGICVYGRLVINGGSVKASSLEDKAVNTDYFEMNGGRLEAAAPDNKSGIYVGEGEALINGGTVITSGKHGIYSTRRINFNGGDVTASGAEKAVYADNRLVLSDKATVKAGEDEASATDVTSTFVKEHDQKWVHVVVPPDPEPAPVDPTAPGTVHSVPGSVSKYVVTSANTVSLVKAPNSKSYTLPATVKIDGKTFNVTGIDAKAFNGTKVKTLTVKTKKLTKGSVKGSLKGSKVKTVKVKVGKKNLNRKYVKKYKKIFTKKNAGRKVKVK